MGVLPISEAGFVHADSSEQQKKKKKKKKKKKPSKKKKSSKKKKKSSKKKKKSSKKESKESAPSAEAIEAPPEKKKTTRFNTAAYADELFNLTGELQASNKELARATRYFYEDEPKKQAVALDSKPYFTREDFEKESKLNPDNLYIQIGRAHV